MAKFRNITDDTLWVDQGNGRLAKVDPGEVVEIDDRERYVQTGETGEPALFERVQVPTRKSAPAEKE